MKPITPRGPPGSPGAAFPIDSYAIRGGRGLVIQFPENREFNREFFRIRPFGAVFVSNRSDKSKVCTPIPSARKNREFFCGNREFFRRNREFAFGVHPYGETQNKELVALYCSYILSGTWLAPVRG